jgi:hypothetical protein
MGDRALFGNSLKPSVAFEPESHPAYREFASQYLGRTAEEVARRTTGSSR